MNGEYGVYSRERAEAIELLTLGADDHPVPGPMFPPDRGGAIQYMDDDVTDARVAYRHKFFRRDEHGQPMPETLIEFFVPGWLCHDSSPNTMALRLIAERMGWS